MLFAVQSLRKISLIKIADPRTKHPNVPMGNILFMYELKTLGQGMSDLLTRRIGEIGGAHFTYLCKESYKFTVRAEIGFVKGA